MKKAIFYCIFGIGSALLALCVGLVFILLEINRFLGILVSPFRKKK